MITLAVEGDSDREAAKAVVRTAGREPGVVYVTRGKNRLDARVPNYMQAAQHSPWVVFRDSDGVCPVALRRNLVPANSSVPDQFALRIAHSMTEAWLLADPEAFGEVFSVSPGKIERDVELLPNGKNALLAVCAQSRSRSIRSDMVASGNRPGKMYVSLINDFARDAWRPLVAAERSDSLRRAIDAIRRMPS